MTYVKAWHFCADKLRDGRPIPPDGEWLVYEGPEVVMCQTGLHASRRIIDAIQYAPGSTVCSVSCNRIVEEEKNDKLVCWERRIDWRIENADDILREFARKVALSVIDLWDAPDVVRKYLETGDEKLRNAARAAARDADWAAARNAAMAVVWATSRNDAREDARAAAWAAARSAAMAVVWDDAISEFNALLEQMLIGATP